MLNILLKDFLSEYCSVCADISLLFNSFNLTLTIPDKTISLCGEITNCQFINAIPSLNLLVICRFKMSESPPVT